MILCAAQWSRVERHQFIHADEFARVVDRTRQVARTAARLAGAAGFAGLMWLLLAGPGFLDGRSSTVDHARHPVTRQAAQ